MKSEEVFLIKCEIKVETPKASLLLREGKEAWFPKSQIKLLECVDGEWSIEVPKWLMEAKNRNSEWKESAPKREKPIQTKMPFLEDQPELSEDIQSQRAIKTSNVISNCSSTKALKVIYKQVEKWEKDGILKERLIEDLRSQCIDKANELESTK